MAKTDHPCPTGLPVPIYPDDLRQFDRVRATLRPRDFAPLKPGVAGLAGRRFELEAYWMLDDDGVRERYTGEWAMAPLGGGEFPGTGLIWIASGDFADFERIGRMFDE